VIGAKYSPCLSTCILSVLPGTWKPHGAIVFQNLEKGDGETSLTFDDVEDEVWLALYILMWYHGGVMQGGEVLWHTMDDAGEESGERSEPVVLQRRYLCAERARSSDFFSIDHLNRYAT
jgi:hypothetical protein